MRGAITNRHARQSRRARPMRAFLLSVALLIAAGALIIQGLTLPGLIRLNRKPGGHGRYLRGGRAKLLRHGLRALVDTALAQVARSTGRPCSPPASQHTPGFRAPPGKGPRGASVDGFTLNRVLTDILQDAAGDSSDDGRGTVDMKRGGRLGAPSRATRSVNSRWRPSRQRDASAGSRREHLLLGGPGRCPRPTRQREVLVTSHGVDN